MTYRIRPRKWPFLSILIFCSYQTFGVELNYVSPEIKSKLSEDFERANQNIDSPLPQNWSCELYGVRTGLQHRKDVALYSMTPNGESNLVNSGASPVKNYVVNDTHTELQGSTGSVHDQIRRKSKSELISKISHAQTKQVLAYAVCKESKS